MPALACESAYRWSPGDASWTQAATGFDSGNFFPLEVYVIAGRLCGHLAEVRCFDPATATFLRSAPLASHQLTETAASEDRLYLGVPAGMGFVVDAYDVAGDAWSTLLTVEEGQLYSLDVLDGRVYVIAEIQTQVAE